MKRKRKKSMMKNVVKSWYIRGSMNEEKETPLFYFIPSVSTISSICLTFLISHWQVVNFDISFIELVNQFCEFLKSSLQFPNLIFSPPSVISCISPACWAMVKGFRFAISNALQISSSEWRPNGSRLNLNEIDWKRNKFEF